MWEALHHISLDFTAGVVKLRLQDCPVISQALQIGIDDVRRWEVAESFGSNGLRKPTSIVVWWEAARRLVYKQAIFPRNDWHRPTILDCGCMQVLVFRRTSVRIKAHTSHADHAMNARALTGRYELVGHGDGEGAAR